MNDRTIPPEGGAWNGDPFLGAILGPKPALVRKQLFEDWDLLLYATILVWEVAHKGHSVAEGVKSATHAVQGRRMLFVGREPSESQLALDVG